MRAFSLICLFGLSLFGCHSEPSPIGNWQYGVDTIEFRSDHTFLQKDHKGNVEGMWMRTQDLITLTPETVGQESVEKLRPRILRKVKPADQKKVQVLLDQWLGVDCFRMDRNGLTMDIVDPTGKRKDSLMRLTVKAS